MASSLLEKELYCPVCFDIFTKPVLLPCSHSFCTDCLQSWWREKIQQECPVCKRVSQEKNPPVNLVLKNLCEAFLLERDQRASAEPEPLCGLHSEKLKLFCVDHKQPVCLICRDSKSHKDHTFLPIDEAAQDHREKLQSSLTALKCRLMRCEQLKANCDQTTEHIGVQHRRVENKIEQHAEKLYTFLIKVQEEMTFNLESQKTHNILLVEENIERLNEEMSAISDTMEATQKLLRVKDISLLQNYKAAVKRVKERTLLDEPRLLWRVLINEADFLGNLTHTFWKKTKAMVPYAPVILDPNTAHPELILSKDLTSVKHGERQNLPDNPERFDSSHSVLGRGFWSGCPSWVVKVGDSENWAVGVVSDSFPRKGNTPDGTGSWTFGYLEGQYVIVSSRSIYYIPVQKKLSQVRVDLDFTCHELSFYDHDTDALLHTFLHQFQEQMFPVITTAHPTPLEILPVVGKSHVDVTDSSDDEEDPFGFIMEEDV